MISFTVLAALAVGLGQLVKGVTGFGSALVAMPMLVALFGPRDALAVMVGVDTLTSLVLLPGIWKLVRWRLVLAVSAPLIAGQFVGTSLLFYVPERPVALLLGALVILLGGSIAWRPSPRGWGELDDLPPGSGPWLWLGSVAGFTGGCLQGLVGASGPPLVAWARRFYSDRFGRAHLIAVFAVGAVLLWAQLTYRTGGLGHRDRASPPVSPRCWAVRCWGSGWHRACRGNCSGAWWACSWWLPDWPSGFAEA